MQSSQTYQKKYVAFEQAKYAYSCEIKAIGDNHRGLKDSEKMEQRYTKAKDEMMKSDDTYKNFVTQLESIRSTWETEMAMACDEFQRLEEDRLKFFRNELWVHINLDSATLFRQDEGNNNARDVMESVNILQELQDFISINKTGNGKPSPILYKGHSLKQSLESSHSTPPATPNQARGFFKSANPKGFTSYEETDPTYSSIGD